MSAMLEFSKHVAEANYNVLPSEAVAATKKQILNIMATIVAGSSSIDIKKLVDLIKDWGGKEESTILGFGGKVPCPNAALINSFSANRLDFDDFHDMDWIAPSRVIIPAAFAIAERKRDVNGKELILAVAIGSDLACRIARASQNNRGSGLAMVGQYFGATASASKILGLNEDRIRNALGLCMMQGVSVGSGIAEALNIKGLGAGIAARAGVFAALMSESGLDGLSDTIEHSKTGYFALFQKNNFNASMLTMDLGKTFEGTTVSIKPFPGCRFNNTSIQASLAMVNDHDIKPEDVAEILVHVGPVTYFNCQPIAERRKPKNAINTQHSLPWSVASAIVNRKVGIEQFTEDAFKDQRVLAMAQKVTCMLTPKLAQIPFAEPAVVDIKTINGKEYSKRVDIAHGSPESPMSFTDIADKFKYCCGFSAKEISTESQSKVIEAVEHLENVQQIGPILRLLG